MSAEMKEFKIECSWDAEVMKSMLNDDTITKADRKRLKQIKEDAINHNTKTDIYKWTNGGCFGRLYAKNSLQTMSKHIRNPLLARNCFELDMVNCHYRFLYQIGSDYGLKTDEIKKYLDNREECLSALHNDRKVSKKLYLMCQYGGNVPELNNLSTECKNIVARLKNDDKWKECFEYSKKEYKKKNNTYKSLDHSFLSFVLQTIECQCIQSIIDFLEQYEPSKFIINMILHDGLIIRNNDAMTDELMVEIEKHVNDETNWDIKLAKKALKHNYNSVELCVVSNEQEASQLVYDTYKNDIVRADDDWYVRLPNTNHYSKGERALRTLVKKMDIYKVGKDSFVEFSQTDKGMNSIVNYLNKNCDDIFPIHSTFIDEVNSRTEGLLFYKDKYWDFSKRMFIDINKNNIPIIYEDRLSPNLNDITQKEIDEYKKKFLNMYNEPELKLFLRALSRALAGHRNDKCWYVLNGLRNSGKGVLQDQVIHAFGSQVANFDMPMIKTNNKQDASDRRWVITTLCHIKRIAFSNEVEQIKGIDPTIDGGCVKKVLASGGDIVKTRGHFKDEMDTRFNAIVFASMNGNPVCNPADALMNCINFKMPYKFVDNPTDIIEKQGNKNIKNELKTDRYRDIFTKLVFDAYDNAIQEKDYTEEIKSSNDDICKENPSEPLVILRKRVRLPTEEEKDKDDYTYFKDIKHLFTPAKMSDNALGRFLKDRGFVKVLKTVFKKNDTVAYKLKIINDEIDTTDALIEDENVVNPE